MLNKEHHEIVRGGAYAIQEFFEENPYVRLDLRRANLSKVDLSGSDLSGSDLFEADLFEANLTGTDLIGANLSGANLSKADLNGANLSRANLFQTRVRETNFENVKFSLTNLSGCDLSTAFGLDSSVHANRSFIDFHALRNLNELPRVFLQGCGLPDSFIEYIPSMLGALNPIDFFSCFISYSHKDKSFANRLHNDLQAKGIRCWLDEHQMKLGDDMFYEVDRGIRLWGQTNFYRIRTFNCK